MQDSSKMTIPKSNKRLGRLIRSGGCQAENTAEYADELKQIIDKAGGASTTKKQSTFFKALADETRLKILKLLKVREMCVCEVMVALDLTQPTASHHLGILENVEILEKRKEGKWVFYRLANPPAN
jgi:hypothetical protein